MAQNIMDNSSRYIFSSFKIIMNQTMLLQVVFKHFQTVVTDYTKHVTDYMHTFF